MKYSVLLLLVFSIPVHSQSLLSNFIKLSCPEKIWVISHPFIAKRAKNISDNARNVSTQMLKDTLLDHDGCGGQVDAFRHTFWMALLVREINQKKAYKLGLAHEKGNKKDFKKSRSEEGELPDAKSSKMDLLNNDIGIKIGFENKNISEKKLVYLIRTAILEGNLWIISKDRLGNYLDCDGKILKKEDCYGKWQNPKCLVRSNNILNSK